MLSLYLLSEGETIMEKKNMINKTNGRKTIAYVTIALLLTGLVIGGTALLNEGKRQTAVNQKKLEDTEIAAEEFKYKGEDEGSILNIQEELAKIDREETKKRQEEFKKQLAEQKQEEERLAEEARVKAEEERLAEEARVKAEEEARIVAEQQAQQQAPKQVTQAPKQNKPAPQPSTKPQEPKVNTQQPESDPGYPVDEYESKEHWEKATADPDWMKDELHYYGYTQNGVDVKGFQE